MSRSSTPAADRGVVRIGVLALQGAFAEHQTHLQRLAPTVEQEYGVELEVVQVRTGPEVAGSGRKGDGSSDPAAADDAFALDGLIIPGGESTAMTRLLKDDRSGLLEALRQFIRARRPVFGTCAGAILLANKIHQPAAMPTPQSAPVTCVSPTESSSAGPPLGGLRVTVARNWYGRQLASFNVDDLQLEADMAAARLKSGKSAAAAKASAIFIRAPAFVEVESGVQVLATLPKQEHHRRITRPDEPALRTEVHTHAVAVRDGAVLATCFHPELTTDTRWHKYFVDMCMKRRQTPRPADQSLPAVDSTDAGMES